MNSLQESLDEANKLIRDLSAEIVVQEATQGHWEQEHVYFPVRRYYDMENDEYRDTWTEGSPAITNQDTEKRESARENLKRIFRSSEWYSVRCKIGRALAINEDELSEMANAWIEELDERRKKTKTFTKEVCIGTRTEYRDVLVKPCGGEDRSWLDTEAYEVPDYEERTHTAPTKDAINASEDLRELYEIHPSKDTRQKISSEKPCATPLRSASLHSGAKHRACLAIRDRTFLVAHP